MIVILVIIFSNAIHLKFITNVIIVHIKTYYVKSILASIQKLEITITKDTHRERALSNKTVALTKSTNMII